MASTSVALVSTTSDVPPFSLTKPRYDQSTYPGRVRSFFESTDPRTLLTSTETLNKSLDLLKSFKDGALPPGITDADLWNARRIKESVVHPDTNEPIFPLFRLSAFAVANLPICALLLWPNPPLMVAVGSQWVNQSFNVCINYANRNASSSMSNATVAASYATAVTVSCGIAAGLRNFVKNTTNPLARAGVPYMAVVAAGCLNLVAMRSNELTQGISVSNETGDVVYGKSVAAGRDAITKCCIARAVWSAPAMFIPSLVMAPLSKTKLLAGSPRLRTATEMTVLFASLLFGVPPALALFPQRDSLPLSSLEPEFQNLKDERGAPVTRVYFNKGL